MSCSALFETSRTYRNRLSTPSGNSSIAVLLLEALGHRVDRVERRLRLQLLRDDRRLEAFGRLAEVIVDDDVLVELFPGVDLGDRLAQPRLELVPHGVDERRLAGARRPGDDEQRAVGVEVTRHSGPARGYARPRFSILRRGCGSPPSVTSSPWC